VVNAALRSSNTNGEIQPQSDDKSKSFVTPIRAVSVLWYGLNPHRYHFFLKRNIVVRILPFLVSLREKVDSMSACN